MDKLIGHMKSRWFNNNTSILNGINNICITSAAIVNAVTIAFVFVYGGAGCIAAARRCAITDAERIMDMMGAGIEAAHITDPIETI